MIARNGSVHATAALLMITEDTSVNHVGTAVWLEGVDERIHTNVVRTTTQRLHGDREPRAPEGSPPTKYDEERMCMVAGAAHKPELLFEEVSL